jgi:phasin family protein
MTEGTKLQESEAVGTKSRGTTTREHAKLARPESFAPAPIGSVAGYGFLLESNQQAFARWFSGITTLSAEVTRFIQNRLQDDMAAWSALASCRTPEEAFECQRHFAEEATAQYSQEITKLSQLMLRLATEGLESFHRCANIGASEAAGQD